MRILKTLMLSAAISAVPIAAFATDLAPMPVEPVAPVPAFTWTGFYAGVNAGYGGGTFKNPFTVSGPQEEVVTIDETPNIVPDSVVLPTRTLLRGKLSDTAGGFVGGGQIGYNYQFDEHWVAGVEADIQYSDIQAKVRATVANFSVQAKTQLDWYGTARLRAGYAFDNILLYGTGGLAYGHVKTSVSAGNFGLSGADSKVGWAAGGGLEYAITPHWTFKTEYLYVDLGKAKTINANLGGGYGVKIDSDVAVHTVRAGLNYKF